MGNQLAVWFRLLLYCSLWWLAQEDPGNSWDDDVSLLDRCHSYPYITLGSHHSIHSTCRGLVKRDSLKQTKSRDYLYQLPHQMIPRRIWDHERPSHALQNPISLYLLHTFKKETYTPFLVAHPHDVVSFVQSRRRNTRGKKDWFHFPSRQTFNESRMKERTSVLIMFLYPSSHIYKKSKLIPFLFTILNTQIANTYILRQLWIATAQH
jgi:hypothetical protein